MPSIVRSGSQFSRLCTNPPRHAASSNPISRSCISAQMGTPASLIRPARELLRRLDPRLAIHEIATLRQDVEASLWSEKLVAALAAAFGLVAMLIVAAGLFALLSFMVSQRTREIGI